MALWPERSGELFKSRLFGSFDAALGAWHCIVPSCHNCISLSHSCFVNVHHQRGGVRGLSRWHRCSYMHQPKSVFSVFKGRILSKRKDFLPHWLRTYFLFSRHEIKAVCEQWLILLSQLLTVNFLIDAQWNLQRILSLISNLQEQFVSFSLFTQPSCWS